MLVIPLGMLLAGIIGKSPIKTLIPFPDSILITSLFNPNFLLFNDLNLILSDMFFCCFFSNCFILLSSSFNCFLILGNCFICFFFSLGVNLSKGSRVPIILPSFDLMVCARLSFSLSICFLILSKFFP